MGVTYWPEMAEAEMWKWTLSGTESVGHPPYRPGIDRRRFLVTSLAGALAAPLAAEAQQARKIPRSGYLAVAPNPPLEDAFRRGLRDWGYVEGQNLLTEYRFAEGIFDRLPGLAAELVGLRVDVIVAITTEGVNAARHATTTIPIVMPISIDPVGAGLVTTLARPGGNVTGISFPIDDLARKRVQLLKETVAMMSHMAILWNPTFQPSARILGWTQAAAAALGVRSQVREVRSPDDFEHALDKIDKARHRPLCDRRPANVWTASTDRRTRDEEPACVNFGVQGISGSGGLVSYGANLSDVFRRAAGYIDKILKGAKPADLPVEQPTKFELVINLKTAKAIGLTIPPSLLLRADQVIE
jgi:putative ABC transport system substrate-binding protein